VLLLLIASCIVDSDHPCGEQQVELTGMYVGCVCKPGYVFSADGKQCVKCAEHEVVRAGECVCDEGFARANSSAACEPLADAGQPAPEDAAIPAVTGEGTACTTSADCEGLYATYCVTLLPPSRCIIQGCATGERKCPTNEVCCSFDDFAPLASTHGICSPPSMCVSPGKQVDP
jgi:hypothetical protein